MIEKGHPWEQPASGPADVTVKDGSLTVAYAWGSLEDDNLKLATQTISGLGSGPGGVHAGESGLAATSQNAASLGALAVALLAFVVLRRSHLTTKAVRR